MCHLIFLVPLMGIPLFWMLPLGYALLINALLWIVCGVLGYKVIKAMMVSPNDGFKSLIDTEAVVVSAESQDYGQYLVKAGHELWTARSTEALRPGERVKVSDVDGIKLVVKRAGQERKVMQDERHCH